MERKIDLQCNKIHHLENTMIIYDIYNSVTSTELIDTVHRMHNTTMWRERTFAGRLNQYRELYLYQEGVGHYTINSILFPTLIREKYVKMYERFLEELKMYSKVIITFSKAIFQYFYYHCDIRCDNEISSHQDIMQHLHYAMGM